MPSGNRTPKALPLVRDALVGALPTLLDRAVENYRVFAMRAPEDDAKSFQLHQAACKAALGHVDLLVRLSRDLGAGAMRDDDGGGHATTSDEKVDALVARAEAAFRQYRGSAR